MLDEYSMAKLLTSVLALLYPQRCPGCNALAEPEEGFCAACRKFLHPIEPPLCWCCGAPFTTSTGPDHLCARCLSRPPSFRQARSWGRYQSGDTIPHPLSTAIQQFKYQRDMSAGKVLAKLGVAHFPWRDQAYDLIVPVPLHRERLRRRGFNQSLILARAIGQARHIEINPLVLARTRATVPQTQLRESERRENVRGAFTVVTPQRLAGKKILLVDDVYTSGATAEECAKTLSRGGAEIVDVFTLARAVSH